MPIQSGVGFSNQTDSMRAGSEAVAAALKEAGTKKCHLVMVWSTSKHDPRRIHAGVRSLVGPDARIIGGYAMGIVTRDHLGYDGYEVGVAVLASDQLKFDMFIEKGLPDNERNVGLGLGKQIVSKDYVGEKSVLVMYDAIKKATTEGLSLNLATPLIDGMTEALRGAWPSAAGVGMLGDLQGNPTYQLFDDRVEQNTAMALVFHGGLRLDTVIMHGCKPASDYHTITKAEGATILEIDGKPALDKVAELLGPHTDKSWQDYPLFVTLGVNRGDKYGEFNDEEYANRLVMAVDQKRRALIMFENDLVAGSEVQLMRRSLDFSYVQQRAQDLMTRIGKRKPVLAIYIDCAGRAKAYCGTDSEEAEQVAKAVSPHMPFLGMYSGVEIAKVGKNMQPLDWTGVLCVLSE